MSTGQGEQARELVPGRTLGAGNLLSYQLKLFSWRTNCQSWSPHIKWTQNWSWTWNWRPRRCHSWSHA